MIAMLIMMLCAAGADEPEVTALRTVTVFESEDHLNFPWVFRGPDGFLSMSCSIGHHTVTERGMALVSNDDGETWESPREDAAGGMGTRLSDGRAVDLSCWGPERAADGTYPITTLFYTNGGRTLDAKVAGSLTLPFVMPPHFHRSIVELPDGTLLATIYGHQEGHEKYSSVLIETRDGGHSWQFRSLIGHSEDAGTEGFCEPALARLANGDLLCVMRVGGPLHATRSTDDGRTWSDPEAVADHGVDPDLLLLSNGMLALSYGRPNVDLMLSADGTGHGWSAPITLYRGPGCHYTSLVEAENGDLMVFFAQSAFGQTPGIGPLNQMRLVRLSINNP